MFKRFGESVYIENSNEGGEKVNFSNEILSIRSESREWSLDRVP